MSATSERIKSVVDYLKRKGQFEGRDYFAEALEIGSGDRACAHSTDKEHVLALWAMFQAEREARLFSRRLGHNHEGATPLSERDGWAPENPVASA